MIKRFLTIFSLVIGNPAFSSEDIIEFPKPSGDYSVGYKIINVTDESRSDPYNLEPYRKIKVTIYYPSNDSFKQETYGAEEATFYKRQLQEPLTAKEITPEEFESIINQIQAARFLNPYG